MPREKQPTPAPSTTGLDSLFQHELSSVNEDIRRRAALAAFAKLRPNNRITVQQFLASLQQHKDIWTVVSTLGVVEFAQTLVGDRKPSAGAAASRPRTRLTEDQKNQLKGAIVRVLDGKTGGLSRAEVAAAIEAGALTPPGIEPAELADKLRQPLHELVAEKKLHTVGEKRLMKYLGGGKKGR